ncbi:MAG: response regulator [Oscillospiraceae bacterium]|nr:response regulator [Oscillospiraceae bacterium]
MGESFAAILRRKRMERNMSQQQLANLLFVDRSSVAGWETGRRVPDATLIARIAACLEVDVADLFDSPEQPEEKPNVILVDDERIILTGGFPILEEVMPGANIVGFTRPSDALEFARNHRVSLAFLDIELGKISGLDLCRTLLEIYPHTNVIFLTAFMEYAFNAWDTGASGFTLKPLTAQAVRKQLSRLRYPVRGLEQP